jgi:ATP-dependent DNA helicase RecG
MGERQTGRNDLKLASLRRDKEWVVRAREAAFSLVDADPHLARHPLLADELRLFFDEDDVDYLFKS